MSATIFPPDFLWGAATASYQIEGGADQDGRGPSIWDTFSHTPGAIRTGEAGDVANDHYGHFKQDVGMMKDMGLKGYRFSISWSRIFPEGRGKVNPKGLDFYSALVDELTAKGITPLITLYHWDLPQALQDVGGWGNRDTADHFADFAGAMFDALGDRAKHWITLNEPWCAAFLGHFEGTHAPGRKDFGLAVNASHHLLLAHAKAVQRYRAVKRSGQIGITLNLGPVYPASDSEEDRKASMISDAFMNRWYLDPVFKGSYPEDLLHLYEEKHLAPRIEPGDIALFQNTKVDFLGVNYYMRHIVASAANERLGFKTVKPANAQLTEMGWEVFPEGLPVLLRRLDEDYGHPEMMVTENGIACKDQTVTGNRVEDDDRIRYLRDHFLAAHEAMRAGVKLRGYFIWTLMDCFEWNDGFSMRFGLASFDKTTMKRELKKSAFWFKDVIVTNGETLT
jgi:beta-glucosidase